MTQRSYFFLALAMLALVAIFPRATVQAASCDNASTATTTPLPGLGAAFNVFSLAHELIIKGTCTDSGILATFGSGQQNQLIYNQAYYSDGGTWRAVTLTGQNKIGPWVVGSAYASIPTTAKQTQVIMYLCQNIGGTWKCGCRDNTCQVPYWQSQTIVRASASTATPRAPSDSSTWVMGYYAGFQSGTFPASEIKYDSLTHIAVGSVKPKPDGTLDARFDKTGDEGTDIAKRIVKDAHRNGKKALLWVGGSDSNDVWKAAASDENRKTFARNLLDLMDDLGYDGLDLDWEPIDAEDQDEVLALVKELRSRDKDALLTLPVMWVASGKDRTSELAWYADVANYVDKIFVMTYSMTGTWSGWQSWFSSPLYGDTTKTPASIDSSVQAFRKAGVPRQQLGFGVGFYARCFVPPVTGPRMDIPSNYLWNVTNLPYSTVLEVLKDPEAKYAWDTTARVPYIYRPTSSKTSTYCSYLSYENEQSLQEKAQYLQKERLGGIIVWTLGLGYVEGAASDRQQPLIDALYKGVVGSK